MVLDDGFLTELRGEPPWRTFVQNLRGEPVYSVLNAVTGSTDMARRAGT